MNSQNKKLLLGIGGLILLVIMIISIILGIKHYMIEKTYEKPINAVLAVEHRTGDEQVTKSNSKIAIYDYPDEGNNYLITITFYLKDSHSTATNQFIVDKTTNHAEDPGVKIPISNLKKLYESNHLKE